MALLLMALFVILTWSGGIAVGKIEENWARNRPEHMRRWFVVASFLFISCGAFWFAFILPLVL